MKDEKTPPTKIHLHNFPPLTPFLQTYLNNLTQSINMEALQESSTNFINALSRMYKLHDAVFKVAENLNGKDNQPLYIVDVYPKFAKFQTWFDIMGTKTFAKGKIFHVNSFIRELVGKITWKYNKKQIDFCAFAENYRGQVALAKWKFNRALSADWVFNTRSFTISKNRNQQTPKTKQFEQIELTTKQHNNFPISSKKTYAENEKLHPITLYELTYSRKKLFQNFYYQFKCGIGSDFFQKGIYTKSELQFQFPMFNSEEVMVVGMGKMAGIWGRSLWDNQLYSRNKRKWMKERSKEYINLRAEARLTNFNLFNFTFVPYVQAWLSRNMLQQKKFQAQYGISLKLLSTELAIDFGLFQMAGQLDKHKLGLRYQF